MSLSTTSTTRSSSTRRQAFDRIGTAGRWAGERARASRAGTREPSSRFDQRLLQRCLPEGSHDRRDHAHRTRGGRPSTATAVVSDIVNIAGQETDSGSYRVARATRLWSSAPTGMRSAFFIRFKVEDRARRAPDSLHIRRSRRVHREHDPERSRRRGRTHADHASYDGGRDFRRHGAGGGLPCVRAAHDHQSALEAVEDRSLGPQNALDGAIRRPRSRP